MRKLSHVVYRGITVWCVIIVAESIHGTIRELWLKPLVGDFRAREIAFFSGLLLIISVALAFVRWLRANSKTQFLQIGALWLLLTLVFEFTLGIFVMGYSWERMFEDYELRKGGLMGFGLLFLLFAPLLADTLRKKFKRTPVLTNATQATLIEPQHR